MTSLLVCRAPGPWPCERPRPTRRWFLAPRTHRCWLGTPVRKHALCDLPSQHGVVPPSFFFCSWSPSLPRQVHLLVSCCLPRIISYCSHCYSPSIRQTIGVAYRLSTVGSVQLLQLSNGVKGSSDVGLPRIDGRCAPQLSDRDGRPAQRRDAIPPPSHSLERPMTCANSIQVQMCADGTSQCTAKRVLLHFKHK